MKKKPVGILTWHYYHNPGSALQAYALQRTIEKLGSSRAEIVNYRKKSAAPYRKGKQALLCFLYRLTGGRVRRFDRPFLYFRQVYMNETACVSDPEALKTLCGRYRAVVCGSDQIWAPNALDPAYLLRYVPEGVDRVSYAASVGLNAIPEELAPVYRENLKRFKAVSVREEKGAELVEAVSGVRAAVMPDPTLLLTAEEWHSLERPVRGLEGKRYAFCYFLKKDHAYRARVAEYARENGLETRGVSLNEADGEWLDTGTPVGPREFLWLVEHADTVITDSYHGTIFSLIFHKRFISIERFTEGEGLCQNSRLDRLKSCFGLKEQFVPQSLPEKLAVKETDYAAFDKKAAALREEAFAFLKNALEEDHA